MLDENKSEVARRLYNAYGETVQETGSWPEVVEFAYQSNWLKLTTLPDGLPLYLSPTRLYEAGTGRFLQRDLIRPRPGLNPYPYGLSKPPRYVDPTGLACCEEEEVAMNRAVARLARSALHAAAKSGPVIRTLVQRIRGPQDYLDQMSRAQDAYQRSVVSGQSFTQQQEHLSRYMAAFSEYRDWRSGQVVFQRQVSHFREALAAVRDAYMNAVQARAAYRECLERTQQYHGEAAIELQREIETLDATINMMPVITAGAILAAPFILAAAEGAAALAVISTAADVAFWCEVANVVTTGGGAIAGGLFMAGGAAHAERGARRAEEHAQERLNRQEELLR